MILYCIICYAFALGIIMGENEDYLQISSGKWIFFFFAPVTVPMYAGYRFEND